ncbi:MAG: protein kinase [Acidobacteriota bacterium]
MPLSPTGSSPTVDAVPVPAPVLPPELFRVGMTVSDRFELKRELGHGAFGVVFEAVDVTSGQEVALKFLNIFLLYAGPDRESARERFRREAEAGNKLRHPLIVQTLGSGEERGLPFIVMELVRGETLATLLIEKGAIPLKEGVEVIADLLTALGHAHGFGIIHRDVKPSNILMDPSGRARLMDFGVAKVVETISGALMTQTGVMGTPSYMSPEQASGGKIDKRSDLFSAGLVAFEVLSGRRAYTGQPASIINKILNEPVPVAKNLPYALQAWLVQACSKDPAARYGSADEMLAALREHMAMMEPQPAVPAARTPAGAPPDTPIPAGPAGAAVAPKTAAKIRFVSDEPPSRVRPVAPRPAVERTDTPSQASVAIRPARGSKSGVLLFGSLGLLVLVIGGGVWMTRGDRGTEGMPSVAGHSTPATTGAVPTNEIPETPAPTLLQEGERLFWQGDFEAASAAFARVLDQDPKNADAKVWVYRARQRALQRPEGVRGMEIREIEVASVRTSPDTVAKVLGPDGKNYDMAVGDRVFDGYVKSIEDDRVVFGKRADPLGTLDSGEVAMVPKTIVAAPVPSGPTGTLWVETAPPGATIVVGGKEAGTTPSEVTLPLKGAREVRIRLRGYEEWSDPHYVLDEPKKSLKVTLNPVAGFIVQIAIAPDELSAEHTKDELIQRGFAAKVQLRGVPFKDEPVPMLIMGPYRAREDADKAAATLHEHGYPEAAVIAN